MEIISNALKTPGKNIRAKTNVKKYLGSKKNPIKYSKSPSRFNIALVRLCRRITLLELAEKALRVIIMIYEGLGWHQPCASMENN